MISFSEAGFGEEWPVFRTLPTGGANVGTAEVSERLWACPWSSDDESLVFTSLSEKNSLRSCEHWAVIYFMAETLP